MSVIGKNKLGIERLGGIGQRVAEEISQRVDVDVRTTVLGHVQRGGSPTPSDRILATRFGIRAVELAHEGKFGEMVCLKGTEITSCKLEEALNKLKKVDPDGSFVKDAEAINICFGR